MRFLEFATKVIKPLTPDQARIDNLKKQKDMAAARLKSERDRQKITRAQHTIADLTKPH
ncbi:MAG: hypothetical protein NTX83_03025 [Burkholderiales bacterium]|nr:hypothetical protein [Burkholderiales bacterium]